MTILSGGSKGMVYFTKMFSYETYRKVKVHNDTINCMLIDENILFTSGFEGYIKLTVIFVLSSLFKTSSSCRFSMDMMSQ